MTDAEEACLSNEITDLKRQAALLKRAVTVANARASFAEGEGAEKDREIRRLQGIIRVLSVEASPEALRSCLKETGA